MKKIKFSKEFIDQFKVEFSNDKDGNVEISLDADFVVYLNHLNSFAATTFKKNKDNRNQDEVLPVKDLLIDQIEYLDFINFKGNANYIEDKFGVKNDFYRS